MPKSSLLATKRAIIFLFLLGLFLWPGQNQYLTILAAPRSVPSRLLTLGFPLNDYPVNLTGKPAPGLSARAALIIDPDSAVILYSKNPQERLLPASTVKIMTALVSLEQYRLEESLVVDGDHGFGQDIKLLPGERLSVINLLSGLLVASANDAAEVLAQGYPGGEAAFLARMNQKARELSLEDTFFANPTGLDTDDQERALHTVSLSTTLDLSRLARVALTEPTFRRLVNTSQITITDVTGTKRHPLFNINALLGLLPGAKGVKTGWTERAGECLIGLVERDGRSLLTVVLGSQDRFGETRRLVEWAFANYQWEKILSG